MELPKQTPSLSARVSGITIHHKAVLHQQF